MPIEVKEVPFSESLGLRLAKPKASPVALYWLGQAGFVIDHGGTRLVIDPYLSDSLAEKYRGKTYPHERMMPAPVSVEGLGPVDLVLCTHHHTDHMDPQTLAPLAAANPAARFVVPEAARGEAEKRAGVGGQRLVLMDAGRTASPLSDVAVSAVRAAHETVETDADGHSRYLGYVIAFGDIRIFHSGDTVAFPGFADEVATHRPALALLPVNGRSETLAANGVPGNLSLDEAVDTCAAAGIPAMIAHHYGMFSFNTVAPEEIDRKAAAAGASVSLTRARTQVEYRL